jgi:MarR family transcriptional regulator, lower aerobic nicotinate degradation pathway regulator
MVHIPTRTSSRCSKGASQIKIATVVLGRLIHHDSATITGVINRLKLRGLIKSNEDPLDSRRREIDLTDKGRRVADAAIETVGEISSETFAPLTREEFRTLTEILKKIIRR